jgi:tetratricopeptide (TPR) repeat protein
MRDSGLNGLILQGKYRRNSNSQKEKEMSLTRLEQLLQFVENDPADPFPKYGVAMEFLGKGELSTAIDWLTRVRQEHPEYVPACYQLGKALADQGKIPLAITVLKEGIRLAEKQQERHTKRELAQLLEELSE